MNLSKLLLMLKGSYSSGNWEHKGRPGKHGGSSPGGGHGKIGLSKGDSAAGKTFVINAVRDKRKNKPKKPTEVKKPEVKKEPEKKVEEKKAESEKFSKAKEDNLKEQYKKYSESCVKAKDPGCVALNTYTGNDFESINAGLRYDSLNGLSSKHKKIVENIDKAMNEAPRTPENMIVYRSMAPGLVNSLIKQGMEFQDRAFVSTSIDPNSTPGKANLEIRIPKGAKGIYVAELSDYGGEKEFLLPRNPKFKVIKSTGESAVLELVVE